jgi:hypothetical protein
MSERVEPALTAAEWEEWFAPIAYAGDLLVDHITREVQDARRAAVRAQVLRRVIALTALEAGPDGGPLFTHEMVDALEAEMRTLDRLPMMDDLISHEQRRLAREAVQRLRALLPPQP